MEKVLFGKTPAGELWHWAVKQDDGSYISKCSPRYKLKTTSNIFPDKLMCSSCLHRYRARFVSARTRERRERREATWPKKWLPEKD